MTYACVRALTLAIARMEIEEEVRALDIVIDERRSDQWNNLSSWEEGS